MPIGGDAFEVWRDDRPGDRFEAVVLDGDVPDRLRPQGVGEFKVRSVTRDELSVELEAQLVSAPAPERNLFDDAVAHPGDDAEVRGRIADHGARDRERSAPAHPEALDAGVDRVLRDQNLPQDAVIPVVGLPLRLARVVEGDDVQRVGRDVNDVEVLTHVGHLDF